MKPVVRRSLLVLGAALIICLGIALYVWNLLNTPSPGSPDEVVTFTVAKGESLDSVSRRLKAADLVADATSLKLAVFFVGGSRDIKAGRHSIPRGVTVWKVHEILRTSPLKEHIVLTIPEGKDIFEIAEAVSQTGLTGAEHFLDLTRDPTPVSDLAPGASSLEGFLFPDTYHIPVDADAETVMNMMLQRTREVLSENLLAAWQAQGLNLEEALTLSSIVAKEAGNEEEMPTIASVFFNRLERGMRLESDPTFIYAAKLANEWDRKIHQSDIRRDSPYNTYLYEGLPPGPVGNPGIHALWAVAQPEDTDFLFFVAKSMDQRLGHAFSSTYREHQRNVARYRQERARVRNESK